MKETVSRNKTMLTLLLQLQLFTVRYRTLKRHLNRKSPFPFSFVVIDDRCAHEPANNDGTRKGQSMGATGGNRRPSRAFLPPRHGRRNYECGLDTLIPIMAA